MIILGVVSGQHSGGFTGPPPAVSANWRVLVHETAELDPFTPASIGELTWLDENGEPISLAGAGFLANHFDGANTPDKAFDDSTGTFWRGFRDDGMLYGINPWLQTLFPDGVEVRGIKLAAADSNLNQCPREFSIQYLSPGGVWITSFKVVAQTDWDAGEERSFQLGGRVWRLAVTSTEEGSKVAIGEIEFRQTANVSERHHDDGGFPMASAQVLPESRFNAFDNDTATVWSTETLPAQIEYWFQTSKPVEQVALFAVADRLDQQPLTTQLFRSDDYGASWVEEGSIPVLIVSGGYGLGYGYFYGGSA